MDLDEDVQPVVEKLDTSLATLEARVDELFDPNEINPETLPEKLSLEEQANLANISAYTIATCYYCLLRANGMEMPPQLREKLARVKEYVAKVKQADVAGKTQQQQQRAVGSKELRAHTKAVVGKMDTAAASPAGKKHRAQVAVDKRPLERFNEE